MEHGQKPNTGELLGVRYVEASDIGSLRLQPRKQLKENTMDQTNYNDGNIPVPVVRNGLKEAKYKLTTEILLEVLDAVETYKDFLKG